MVLKKIVQNKFRWIFANKTARYFLRKKWKHKVSLINFISGARNLSFHMTLKNNILKCIKIDAITMKSEHVLLQTKFNSYRAFRRSHFTDDENSRENFATFIFVSGKRKKEIFSKRKLRKTFSQFCFNSTTNSTRKSRERITVSSDPWLIWYWTEKGRGKVLKSLCKVSVKIWKRENIRRFPLQGFEKLCNRKKIMKISLHNCSTSSI